MKRFVRCLLCASLLAVMLAVPTVAHAVGWTISQEPDTTGMTFQAGSWTTVSWVSSEEIPANAEMSLMIAHQDGGVLYSETVQSGLALSDSIEVQLPTEGGPYFYYISAYWVDPDGKDYDAESYAYWDWVMGSPWWFTIGNSPGITAHPQPQWVAAGDTGTFTASAEGTPTPDVQWQVNDGNGWADIEGANSDSYTTPDVTDSMDGWFYRAVFSNSLGSATTNPAALWLDRSITQLPNTTGMTYAAGSELGVSWVSQGVPEDAAVVLEIASSTGPNQLQYHAVASGLPVSGSTTVTVPTSGGPYFYFIKADWTDDRGDHTQESDAMAAWNQGKPWWFTVFVSPSIADDPVDQTVQAGVPATFTASANGEPQPDVQWQLNDGTGWADVSGATSETYVTPPATAAMNGWQYRAVFDNGHGTATSAAAKLSVMQSVTISAPSATLVTAKGKTTASFTADVSTPGAASETAFVLHLEQQTKVKGKSVWAPEITVPMVADESGRLSATRLMARGTWRMQVTSNASTHFVASSSSQVTFTVP